MSEQEVVDLANRYLHKPRTGAINMNALANGIRERLGVWFVPVQPDKEPENRYQYYDYISVVETEIEEETDVTIVFEPVLSAEDEASDSIYLNNAQHLATVR